MIGHDRIEEARILLAELGMDNARSNERSALTLLSLLQLGPNDPWVNASNPLIGINGMRKWMREEYEKDYAVGSRETIRKFTLHQFEDAGLVVANPDDPTRSVNSNLNNYQVVPEALVMIQAYGTQGFDEEMAAYLTRVPGLLVRYAAARASERLPVKLPDGSELTLSPGGQNVLIKLMIEEFCPQFTPGGELLYVGDADEKLAVFELERFRQLGLTFDEHGKMPDLVVYVPARGWLVLMEAVTSHGPVDGRRRHSLATLFDGSSAGLVFVSCFPDRATFRRYVADIAWETEVWCADNPTHMIHFNGERFLGPYT